MKYQFSFELKYELIVVNGQAYMNNIGALMTSLIDMDWEAFKGQVISWKEKEIPAVCWDKHVAAVLESVKCHPVLRLYVMDAVYQGVLLEKLETLSENKQKLLRVLEILVDEDRGNYITRLYEQFYELVERNIQTSIYAAKLVRKLSLREQKEILDSTPEGIRVRFETEEIRALIFCELYFLCSQSFIIRKCAHCRGFFWTRVTNRVYCSRAVPGKQVACNRYGPQRKRQIEKRPAYKLYWDQRAKAFQQAAREEDKYAFQTWVKAAQPFKSLARRGEISLEDMTTALQKIEEQVFPSLHLARQQMNG